MSSSLNDIRIIDFNSYKEKNGTLVPVEVGKEIPFNIARIFYVRDVPIGQIRGKHSHKNQKQLLICVSGKCEVILRDTQHVKRIFLERADKGVYIPSGIWGEFIYHEPETVVVVLTDEHYDSHDYINTWKEFLEFKKNSDI